MSETVVQTSAGAVVGHGNGEVVAFRGVPFGADTSTTRWRPPEPPKPWSEPRRAEHAGPSAPQNPSGLEAFLGGTDVAISEDCLALNVWTPACDTAQRPVMVWIHGGAFETGSGAIPWYDGTHLAARDVVVVTINYRLGALGFLHLDELGGESFAGSGNVGISDQVAALRWVRENIAGFGGAPGNITIFGESAGAMSVGTLLGSPEARGLFHKAILQSGAASHIASPETATRVAERLLGELGGISLERLHDLGLIDLLEAQRKLSLQASVLDGGLPFQPVVDGVVIADQPLRAVEAGELAGVPMIVGTNSEEMKLFLMLAGASGEMSEESLQRRLDQVLGGEGRLGPGAASKTYRARLGADAATREVWSAVLTDHTFRIPAVRLAERHAQHEQNTFMYQFTQPSPIFGGAAHAVEIPFVFDNLDKNGIEMLLGPIDDHLRSLATAMADAWTTFARTGVPAADGLPAWEPYDPQRRATLVVGVDRQIVGDPQGDERQLWDGLLM